MKYVFFGTPRFAEIVLRGLLEGGLIPLALVANPDRPVGRKKIITAPPTKQLIQEHVGSHPSAAAITIYQPEKLDEHFINDLRAFAPDFFVVAAYAKIIPASVLAIPRLGTIGVHPSLLPKYRGASPIQSAILDGATETGLTLYLMDEKMDHGPVLREHSVPLESLMTDYPALEEELAKLGASMLNKLLPSFLEGKMSPTPQDETAATFTKKFATDDGRIDESDIARAESNDEALARAIIRKINAFTPEPGAWTIHNGKRVKLLKARLESGRLKLLLTQTEGEKPRAL